MPPRLPPRSPSQASSISSLSESSSPTGLPRQNTIHLTPQSFQNNPYSHQDGLNDPRTSSTQSLRPIESAGPDRRTLLVVFIHGFMGNETSFRSFPAHVHSLLTITLAESYVVHTKIYPRYQSRKNISFARDAFSNWLAPHEGPKTDVILVGHSLGGILGAEVVLIPSHTPGSYEALQHRILGLIAFDTPYLGMHPGVVSTGIASLFRGAPEPADQVLESSSNSSFSNPWIPSDRTSSDPNFNPAFPNDVNLPVRNNKWERAWYFMNKHAGELRKATQSYVKSHLEFGGCLADYPGLKRRYEAVRALEDVDELKRRKNNDGKLLRRVRFVNYYTASSGRIKEQKPTVNNGMLTTTTELKTMNTDSSGMLSPHSSQSPTPRLSLEEHREEGIIDKTEQLSIDHDEEHDEPLQVMEPQVHEEDTDEANEPAAPQAPTEVNDLPPLPPDPILPPDLDTSHYSNPDSLRLAQKEHGRQMKAYEKARKDRQKAIRDREKIIAKREKQLQKEQEKATKLTEQNEQRLHKESLERRTTLNPENQDKQMREEAKDQQSPVPKKKKDRKFCTLPSKDQKGHRDSTWIRVYMEGMDEVVAHTSLFFVNETYAKLVGDVAQRVEQWVNEDATTRILLDEPVQ